MKAYALVTTFCFVAVSASAQITAGQIRYTETVKLAIDVPEEAKQFSHLFPDEQSISKVLLFTDTETLYKDFEKSQDEVIENTADGGNFQMKVVMERPESEVYTNLSENKIIQRQEFYGKTFLIDDSETELVWKLSNEQKDILGFTCFKAMAVDSNTNAVAWFAPQIAVSGGPFSYNRLPGMILELTLDDGRIHVLAESVEKADAKDIAINAPKKGKRVSRAEFERISEAKQKEMEEEYGGRGIQIRIDN